MSGCGNCTGDCASCGGCTGALVLNTGEVEMLRKLAQIPFLPVARRMDETAPVYLEDDRYTPEEYSLILQCLEKKNLISLDFDKPLRCFDDTAYRAWPIRGSMALTYRGLQVVELLEIQGAE